MRFITSSILITLTILIAHPVYALDVTVESIPLQDSMCSGQFVEHALDFITQASTPVIRFYDSDGAGLALNDLNNDGLIDIVLANLKGRNAIFWNEGSFQFRKEVLSDGQSRAANIIDVDGDSWLDIVFTHSLSAPSYWHNSESRFNFGTLPGVRKPSYSMTWGDVNGDSALDLMTGTYDSDLGLRLRDSFLFNGGGGVYYYAQLDGAFVPTQLADNAQALAILLTDINRDGAPDLMVGNDFVTRDQVWTYKDGNWQAIEPFESMTRNTMSFDTGDINNDGFDELFAADMKPYNSDPNTLAEWKPVFDSFTDHPLVKGDPQINENVLQVAGVDGLFRNEGQTMGVDATGWSWSAQFGDLNNDGFLDLYVVNGMTAAELFHQLPGDELIEENQVLRNEEGKRFVRENDWGLNSSASGRGMSMADLDNDGDLDIVINNLESPAVVFENQVCEGNNLEVDLRWLSSRNTRALGARLSLVTSSGTYYRDVRAASGYISGDTARVHFGFPQNTNLETLEIQWPDGEISRIETPPAHTLLTVSRS